MVRKLCLNCLRPEKECLCKSIPSFRTRQKIVILMHPKEYRKGINTGRLTRRAISNCELFVGPDFSSIPRLTELLSEYQNRSYVLFPGSNAIDIEELKLDPCSQQESLFFILDGTWAMAKKMLSLNPSLQQLPQVQFAPKFSSQYKIRRQPAPQCLSTIESVYTVIESLNLDSDNRHKSLLELLDQLVSRQEGYEQSQRMKGKCHEFNRVKQSRNL